MTRLDSVQDGCWVNLTYPSEDELNTVAVTLGVEPSFLRAALDEEETSRIDTEDGQTLIIIDVPAVEKDDAVVYSTCLLYTSNFAAAFSLILWYTGYMTGKARRHTWQEQKSKK